MKERMDILSQSSEHLEVRRMTRSASQTTVERGMCVPLVKYTSRRTEMKFVYYF